MYAIYEQINQHIDRICIRNQHTCNTKDETGTKTTNLGNFFMVHDLICIKV